MPAVYLPPNFLRKAEVARSECERDGDSDLEVFFSSQEEANPPNVLATGAGQCFRRISRWEYYCPRIAGQIKKTVIIMTVLLFLISKCKCNFRFTRYFAIYSCNCFSFTNRTAYTCHFYF